MVVRWWLLLVQALARGPLRRVPPDALSGTGVVVGGAAVLAAGAGAPAAAAALVVATGVLDGLDGAVAVETGRARPLGAVVDALADRAGDLLLAGVLLALGGAPAWVAAFAAVVLLHEYLRARANAAGMPGPGAVTVAERPTRVILVAACALAAAAVPGLLPWGTAGAVAGVVVGAAGFVHLALAVVRDVPAAPAVPAFPASSATSPATMPADSSTSGSPPPGWDEPPTR
jgi:CDP-diacylglycerol--glycerol-3-phosphate 3-phosphatidyltransferase